MPTLNTVIKQASRGADLYFVFRFLRLLTMKYEKTDAYKYGIIDKKGKVLKKPVYELLGGSVIEKLPLYASSYNTEWLKELGFKNFKRFISYGPRDGIDGLKKTEDEIAKTREIIGYKSDLMLDCWLSMDIETKTCNIVSFVRVVYYHFLTKYMYT